MSGEGDSIESKVDNLLDGKSNQLEGIKIFEKMNEISKERKFNESVEVIVKLNADPTQGD